jgi:VCBS repeat-containing protein
VTAAAPGVLANDSDAEGDLLTAVQQSDPGHGTVVMNDDGSFTYTHNGSETASDSFSYVAFDGNDYSEVTGVEIVIRPPVVLATVTVTGQIQTDDPWVGDWDKPMYYFWFDDNGNPADGPYGNGQGPASVIARLDTGRFGWQWFGPDRTWNTTDDVVYALTAEDSPGHWDLGDGITADLSGDGRSLTVSFPMELMGDPADLDVSFMASAWTFSAVDNMPTWITVDTTVTGTSDLADPAGDENWPGLDPDRSSNFDLTQGAVTIG